MSDNFDRRWRDNCSSCRWDRNRDRDRRDNRRDDRRDDRRNRCNCNDTWPWR